MPRMGPCGTQRWQVTVARQKMFSLAISKWHIRLPLQKSTRDSLHIFLGGVSSERLLDPCSSYIVTQASDQSVNQSQDFPLFWCDG